MPEQVFTTPGADQWIVPEGVTSITVECWGGGGAGGDRVTFGGGGGGGGEYVRVVFACVAGEHVNVTVGSGGAAGEDGLRSGTASLASFGEEPARNTGAAGGSCPVDTADAWNMGPGGDSGGSIVEGGASIQVYAGGTGGGSGEETEHGAGGGGSGSPTGFGAAGVDAQVSAGAGGASGLPDSGDGGNGGTALITNGQNGQAPGGGGGGCGDGTLAGDGARGQVRIRWDLSARRQTSLSIGGVGIGF